METCAEFRSKCKCTQRNVFSKNFRLHCSWTAELLNVIVSRLCHIKLILIAVVTVILLTGEFN